jgi:putative acetyltransferase
MRSITPLESKHALDLDGLRKPEITFWSVMDGDTIVGCGAVKTLDASHAEVKSMRTRQRANGVGSHPSCSSTSSPRPNSWGSPG